MATWSAPSIRSKWISAKKIKNNKKKKIIRKQKILHVIRKMCNSDAGCHVLDFLALTFLFRTFDLIFRDKPSVDFFLFSRRRRVKGILKKKRSKKRLRIAPVSVLLPSFTGFYWVLLGFTGFYWVLPSFTGFFSGCRAVRRRRTARTCLRTCRVATTRAVRSVRTNRIVSSSPWVRFSFNNKKKT